MQKPFTELPPCPQEEQLAAARFLSFEAYKEWLTHTAGTCNSLQLLYDPDYAYAAILDERLDTKQQLQYLIRLTPCAVRRVHLPCLHAADRIKTATPLHTEGQDPASPQALYLVEWEGSWESADNVHKYPESTPLFEPYMQTRAAARLAARSDTRLSAAAQQGHPTAATRPETGLTLSPQLAALIDIDPLRTCNPDADTLATGRRPSTAALTPSPAQCHLPCGRYAGSLPLARLDLLHTAYMAHGTQDTGCEEAVAQLLMRKRPKETGKSHTCRLPAALVTALQRGLQLDTELFASCLTFDSGMRSYCSTEPGDEQFGANPDAYTGTAAWARRTLCVPPQDSASMLKALRWAIASAEKPDSTSLTALVVTPAPSAAYKRWLNHLSVREVLTVPGSFLRTDTGTGQVSRSPTARLLLLVGSTAELSRVNVAQLHKEVSRACATAADNACHCYKSEEAAARSGGSHTCTAPPVVSTPERTAQQTD